MKKQKKFKKEFHNQIAQPKNSKHHIMPYSRSKDDSEENIVYINKDIHDKYHALFQNRTPYEAIDFLVNYFFAGNTAILHSYLIAKEAENAN